MNLQQFDTRKRLKIKAAQNIFTTEVKVNERNIQADKDESKSFYTATFWLKSLKIIIVANKKLSIRQHNFNMFALKQRVYSNDNDSKDDVTAIMMRMNWELNKRLRRSTLVITHHKKLKELVARAKHLADVVIVNQECHEKIYKIYNDSQTSLKTVKVIILIKNQTRLQQVQIMHESI